MRCIADLPWFPLRFTGGGTTRYLVAYGVVVLVLILLAVNPEGIAWAQEAQFRPGELIKAGANSLAPGSYAIPCATDWNGDGRKDLLVGYQPVGRIAFFANAGTDASPDFASYINLQAGGVDIVHPSSGCGAPAPFVCDYDSDGKRDLLVGDGGNGNVYFYRNLNTDAAPVLAPGVRLMVGGSALSVVSRATPCCHDWDGDGLNDLLCGNGDGNVFFFKNMGTAQVPAYAAGTLVQAGGANLNLGIRSVVRVIDWDGDGVEDLVGSSDTGVYWCRNIGSHGAPMLQPRLALRAPVASGGLASIYTGPRMRLDLVDWDDDGVIDLLLGNAAGTVSLFDGYRFAFTGITPWGRLQWNSAPYLNYHVLAGASPEAIPNIVAAGLASGGNTTSWTNSPVTNQQFYRLQVAP